jgi:hypothetical protein
MTILNIIFAIKLITLNEFDNDERLASKISFICCCVSSIIGVKLLSNNVVKNFNEEELNV